MSALKLRIIPVNFEGGESGQARSEGNNAAWICRCGESIPLLGRCFPPNNPSETVCPVPKCGRRYIVQLGPGNRPYSVKEISPRSCALAEMNCVVSRSGDFFENIDMIRQSGFDGFVTISSLQKSNCREVPSDPGVYLVVRTEAAPPEFLNESIGGHFKGKTPTVLVSVLESKWVDDAVVLYIGKAGPDENRTLKTRLNEYMQFGQGTPIGHSGGRFIWQLGGSGNLLVCWKPTPNTDPRTVEKDLIQQFQAVYKKLPFANIYH